MTNIKLIVNGSKIRAEVDGVLTSGSVGIPVTIDYDSSWNGLTKHLVCTSGKWGPTGKRRTMLNVDTTSTVPHEVMIADEHLYIGIEGRRANGLQVIRTILVDCGTIFPGADANADVSVKPTLPVWAQLQRQIDALNELVTGTHTNGSTALTKPQMEALHGMFKVALFDSSKNVSGAVAAYETAFDLSDSGDEAPEETITTYTITNNLSNITTDNMSESVERGMLYSANLTPAEGYSIDHVVITMGGVEINAYGDGVISIDAVIGDVIITATAVQTNTGAAVYELAEVTDFDGTSVIDTGYTLSLTNDAWTICADFTGTAGTVFASHGTVDAHEMRVTLVSSYYWQASLCGKAVNGYTKNKECKYVITHGKGETQATAYYLSGDSITSDFGATHWGSANSNPTTLKLGGNRNGTASFIGTINRFSIYERVLTAEEISEFMEEE